MRKLCVPKLRYHVFRLFVVYPESSFPSALPGQPMVLLIVQQKKIYGFVSDIPRQRMDLYTSTQHMLLTQEDMCVWQPIQLALNANELICRFLVKVLGLDKYMCFYKSEVQLHNFSCSARSNFTFSPFLAALVKKI